MGKAMEILSAAGVGTEDAAAIEKQLLEHYRTREETEKKAARIKELESEGESLRAEVAKLSDTTETEELRNRVKEFEEREQARKAKDAEAAARAEFRKDFDAAVGKRRFANERTEKSVFEDAFKARVANPDMSAEDILKPLVADDGIFANPQQTNAPTVPLPKDGAKSDDSEQRAFVASLFKTNEKEA